MNRSDFIQQSLLVFTKEKEERFNYLPWQRMEKCGWKRQQGRISGHFYVNGKEQPIYENKDW